MPPKTTRCTYLARLSELLNPGRANLGLEIWILRILRGHNHCFWCKNLRQKQTVLQMKRSGLEKRKNNAQVRDLFFLAAFWLLITKIFSTESIYLYTPPPRTQLDAVKSAGEFLCRKAEAEVGGTQKPTMKIGECYPEIRGHQNTKLPLRKVTLGKLLHFCTTKMKRAWGD